MKTLLEAGVHFGHQTRRWDPRMRPFIFTERNGIHIIDLQQTVRRLDEAMGFVRQQAAEGKTMLFVGTKKQAQGSIAEQAQRVGQPYVNQRWLGGLLTNFQTVHKRLNRLKELDLVDFDDTTRGYTKKELLIQRRERDKLEKTLGGIRNLTKTPSALWVVDTKKEHLAIDEAKKLGIPVIGILDTNCDPDEVQYPIPGNDDAIRSVSLLTRIIADAAAEGLIQRHQKPEEGAEAPEPLADWERELLQQSTDAAATTDTATTDAAATTDAVLPTEENDADAQASADLAATTDESLTVETAPETQADVEERIESQATEDEKAPIASSDNN